jgi:hypothetical protein
MPAIASTGAMLSSGHQRHQLEVGLSLPNLIQTSLTRLGALGQVFGTSDPDEAAAVNCSYRSRCYPSLLPQRLSVSALTPCLVTNLPRTGPPWLFRSVGTVPFPTLALRHSTIRAPRSRYRLFCCFELKHVRHISNSLVCVSLS